MLALHHGDRFDADTVRQLAFSDRAKNGGPLGAVGKPVRSVLDVAPRDDLSLAGKQRRANVKVGIRRISRLVAARRRPVSGRSSYSEPAS